MTRNAFQVTYHPNGIENFHVGPFNGLQPMNYITHVIAWTGKHGEPTGRRGYIGRVEVNGVMQWRFVQAG